MRAIACLMFLASLARADVPVIKADDVVATAASALAKPDATAAPGAMTRIAWVDKVTDIKATAKSMRAAIAAAKLTIVWEEIDDGSLSFVVENTTTKARALIGASLWNSNVYVTPKPVLGTKLPGTCVSVPIVTHSFRMDSRGVDQRGERHTSHRDHQMRTASILDVDGDAVPDTFVPVPPTKHACRDETPHRVYVMRGTCGHEVGILGPGWFDMDTMGAPPDASGLRPLSFNAERARYSTRVQPGGPIPELVSTKRTFVGTKGRYAKTKESTSAGICHHCSVWHCQGQ